MKKTYRLIAVTLVLLLVAMIVGCGGGGKGTDSGAKAPVKIGMVVSLTGGAAGYGIHMRNGAQMAVDELNAAGGVNGRKIELIVEDDASDPSKAATALNRLAVQSNVDAVVGGANSTICFAMKDIVEQQGIPFITTSGSNPKLTGPSNKFFFRLHQSDSTVAQQAADFATKILGLKNIGILHDTADYGIGNKEFFTEQLGKTGMKAKIIEVFNVGDQDFTPQILNLKNANIDGIGLFANLPEAPMATKQIRQIGLKNVPIIMTGISVPKYIELAPGDSEGAFAITPFNPNVQDPEVQKLAKTYKEKYNMDASHHVSNTYQAVYVLKQVWEKVGTDSKEKVVAEMKNVSWKAFGSNNKFDATGQVLMKSIVVQVKGGQWTVYKDQL